MRSIGYNYLHHCLVEPVPSSEASLAYSAGPLEGRAHAVVVAPPAADLATHFREV